MAQINALEPRLLVQDLDRCMQFYTAHLGFSVGTQMEGFAILENGDVRLQISETKDGSNLSTCTIWLDVDNVHDYLESTVEWGPEDYSYGRREFAIRDPAGNLIVLSQII